MTEKINNNSVTNSNYEYKNREFKKYDMEDIDISTFFETDININNTSEYSEIKRNKNDFEDEETVLNTSTAPSETTPDDKLKKEKENELIEAQNNYNKIFTGENKNVKEAQEKYNSAKNEFIKLLNKDNSLMKFRKDKLLDNINKAEDLNNQINNAEIQRQINENSIMNKEIAIADYEANIAVLRQALTILKNQLNENPDKKAEIDSKTNEINNKISELEKKVQENKSGIDELKLQKEVKSKKLNFFQKFLSLFGKKYEEEITPDNLRNKLAKIQKNKNKYEKELILDNKEASNSLKSALTTFNEADLNLQNIKMTEAANAKDNIQKIQTELKEINQKNNENKLEKILPNNSVSAFKFDFTENLTSEQKEDLEVFKNKYQQNKDKYKEVEKITGLPAELIAAIHYRESNGNFGTYLHNGDELGRPTEHYPEGIYFDKDQWVEAAIDALQREGCNDVNTKDLDSLLYFAEKYNGFGYRNRNEVSPYIWSGTTKYTSGKFVSDGSYDKDYVDKQLGIAVMMKAIC